MVQDVANVIADPSIAVVGARAPLVGGEHFRGGQAFAQNNSRERAIQQLFETIGGNNELRTALAQRLQAAQLEQDRFNTVATNVKDLASVGGRDQVLTELLDLPTTGFSTTRDLSEVAQGRADVGKTLGETQKLFREGGEDPTFEAIQKLVGGITGLVPGDPTGVLTARAGNENLGIKVKGPVVGSGTTFEATFPADLPGQSPVGLSIDAVTGGLRPGGLQPVPGAPPNAAPPVEDKSAAIGQLLQSVAGPPIKADVPPASMTGVSEPQINSVNKSIAQIRSMTIYAGREIEARNGPDGTILIIALPDRVVRIVDVQGKTVNG